MEPFSWEELEARILAQEPEHLRAEILSRLNEILEKTPLNPEAYRNPRPFGVDVTRINQNIVWLYNTLSVLLQTPEGHNKLRQIYSSLPYAKGKEFNWFCQTISNNYPPFYGDVPTGGEICPFSLFFSRIVKLKFLFELGRKPVEVIKEERVYG